MEQNEREANLNNVNWKIEDMIEIQLNNEDDFLKIKETLTRIGIPAYKDKVLYQSCHILHKRHKYYIVHFKELFALDGRPNSLSEEDVKRRNTIIKLLVDWNMCTIVEDSDTIMENVDTHSVKIIKFGDKEDWTLQTKYNMGINK